MKSAVFLHTIDWASDLTNVELVKGVEVCKTEGSNVEQLYHHLCKTENVDQGEPFDFSSHILINEPALDDSFPDWRGPYSIVSKVCNIIAICLSSPLGMCRIIITKDDFQNSWVPSEIIYDDHFELDFLRARPDQLEFHNNGNMTIHGVDYKSLDDESLNNIVICFNNQFTILGATKDINRLENALNYFFNSWSSYRMEHVCLNLSIAIESLFSPASNMELSHRIAFNVSRFFGTNRQERENIYDLIRNFYNIRSKIVHGGGPKDRDLYSITPRVFNLVSLVLRRILLNKEIMASFCDNKKMSLLFRDWAFE